MNGIAQGPPRWAERLLEWMLPAEKREEIAGDLREEYVESMLPRHGRMCANVWYVRHVLSFLPGALRESRMMRGLLIGTSFFTAIGMLWLASMEAILRHSMYALHMTQDILFATLCAVVIFERFLPSPQAIRADCLRGGGALMIVLGFVTFLENIRAEHFEGFVFVISLLLMLQGILMLLTLGRRGANAPHQPAQ